MYARRKKWPLESVKVHIDHYKDYAQDQKECADEKPAQIDHFERVLDIEGDLSEEQLDRLLEIADRCPVHRTLHNPVEIRTILKGHPKE
jgi:putative redox protein